MTRAPSFAEHALRRNWKGVLLLAAVAGLPLSWLLSTVPQTTYRVTQGYVVADVAEDGGKYVTANSDRAARDYAAVLRTDGALVDQLASRMDVPADGVRDRLSAGYLPGAGTLFVRYDADYRREVLDVMAALDSILASSGAPAGGIAPGAVTPLGLPPVEELGTRVNVFPGAGFLVALLGAACAALLLERLRPQVGEAGELRLVTDRPVLDLDGPNGADLLAHRVLLSEPDVVLVHAVGASDAAARGVRATTTAEDLRAAVSRLVGAGELDRSARDVPVLVVGDLAEARGWSARPTWVLVAALPGSQRAVEDTLEELLRSADVVIALRNSAPQAVPV